MDQKIYEIILYINLFKRIINELLASLVLICTVFMFVLAKLQAIFLVAGIYIVL